TTSSQLKLANGASCTVSSQCASNLCDQGICKVATGGSCTSNSQCANYNFCTNGVCTYIYCISHSQCTSGLCYGYGSSKYCLSTTTTLTIACSDSDADAISGIKPTIPGQVTQQNGVAKDKCGGVYDGSPTAGLQPVNTINEVFCSGRYGMNVTVVCPNSFHVCKLDPQGYAYCSTPTFVTK
ncbi:MAG: hypothetical protein Q8R37_01345, partial [Nanoarchaeota archaeon]|nr:hypothetical protein [Nanoarchaeota archaeon]